MQHALNQCDVKRIIGEVQVMRVTCLEVDWVVAFLGIRHGDCVRRLGNSHQFTRAAAVPELTRERTVTAADIEDASPRKTIQPKNDVRGTALASWLDKRVFVV